MAELAQENGGNGGARIESRRRSLLELAPLELDCMNTLWPIGEGTVREIRDLLAPRTPRAYTTIMTIMDRLARKGIVERRKAGRAYVYRPSLSANEARDHALGKVVESFFGGSREDAVAFLSGAAYTIAPRDDAGASNAQASETDSVASFTATLSSPPLNAVPSKAILATPTPSSSPVAMAAEASRATKARAATAAASASASVFSVSAAPPASASVNDADVGQTALVETDAAGVVAAHADAVAALQTEERSGESSRMDDTLL
jgi:predicted transcriptional regulator